MSSEHENTSDTQTYSQNYTPEDDRTRISGHVVRGQNDAWFPPAPLFQAEPAFQISFYAIGAPITIRFRALRQSTQQVLPTVMFAAAPGAVLQPNPGGGSVVHLRRPPFERLGSFGTGTVFDPVDPPLPLPDPPVPPLSVDRSVFTPQVATNRPKHG